MTRVPKDAEPWLVGKEGKHEGQGCNVVVDDDVDVSVVINVHDDEAATLSC